MSDAVMLILATGLPDETPTSIHFFSRLTKDNPGNTLTSKYTDNNVREIIFFPKTFENFPGCEGASTPK